MAIADLQSPLLVFSRFYCPRCRDDPEYADAVRIENTLGIAVVRHEAKKPGGIEDVLAFFAEKDPDVRLDELCFVGDRLLTDVVFGNLHGMLTIHTQPLTLEGDNRPAAIFRFLERKVTGSPTCETNRVVSLLLVMLQNFLSCTSIHGMY